MPCLTQCTILNSPPPPPPPPLKKPVLKIFITPLCFTPPPPPPPPHQFSKRNTKSFLHSTAGTNALPANRTQLGVFGVQQPNSEVQPLPSRAHPHNRHPTPYNPTPYQEEEAPQPLPPNVKAEEECHDDNQYDQPNQSQLDHDATASMILWMEGSGRGSESGGWRGCEDVCLCTTKPTSDTLCKTPLVNVIMNIGYGLRLCPTGYKTRYMQRERSLHEWNQGSAEGETRGTSEA